MTKFHYYRFTLISLVSIFCTTLQAKVDPPNYNFSLDALSVFMPDQKKSEIEKKYKNGTLFFQNSNLSVYRYYVAHLRYHFAIFVQYRDDTVVDFHASLPTYFLHDIFHQSLINRIGKQDEFLNKNEQSVYIWKNKNGMKHIYSGACTITCFPLYYSVVKIQNNDSSNYMPIIELLGKD